jgi:hypothetical protein
MRRLDRPYKTLLLFVSLLATAGGCSNALETGYVPRALGASSTERRGYYASPFTPEAAAAQQFRASDQGNDTRPLHRPGGYR